MRPVSQGGMLYIPKALEASPSVEDYFRIFMDKRNLPIIRRFNNTPDKILERMLKSQLPRWENLLEMLSTYPTKYPALQARARLALYPVGTPLVCAEWGVLLGCAVGCACRPRHYDLVIDIPSPHTVSDQETQGQQTRFGWVDTNDRMARLQKDREPYHDGKGDSRSE